MAAKYKHKGRIDVFQKEKDQSKLWTIAGWTVGLILFFWIIGSVNPG